MDEREFGKWFSEARAAFKAINSDLRDGNFNWACFKAQQAAEFALKALLWACGKPAFGHSLLDLGDQLEKELKISASQLREELARLEKYYVPTRYANQWTSRPPHLCFTEREAEEAKGLAKRILEWIESQWESLRRGGN